MEILAIDPGNIESAFVVYDLLTGDIKDKGKILNSEMLRYVRHYDSDVVIEMIACYGMPVGESVFETVVWIGRFIEASRYTVKRVYRRNIKLHLCNSARAKDGNVRQALIDIYGGESKAMGGVKCPKCKGKGWFGAGRPVCDACNGEKWKYPPGKLYGVSSDVWAALAVAVYYKDCGPDNEVEHVI